MITPLMGTIITRMTTTIMQVTTTMADTSIAVMGTKLHL